jgi:hypothetical protein
MSLRDEDIRPNRTRDRRPLSNDVLFYRTNIEMYFCKFNIKTTKSYQKIHKTYNTFIANLSHQQTELTTPEKSDTTAPWKTAVLQLKLVLFRWKQR